MLAVLLLMLLFGGLGLWVAKWFLIALVVLVLVSLLTGGGYYGRRRWR